MYFRKYLPALFLLLFCLANSLAFALPTPIVEYCFNETGTQAINTGSSSAPLNLYTSKGLTDLHSVPEFGVSGLFSDRAFDNSQATQMGGKGVGYGRGVSAVSGEELLGGAKNALTVQGWFWADNPWTAGGVILYIPGMIDIRHVGNDPGKIKFMTYNHASLTPAESPAVYNQTKEWIFFAVTWDGTSQENNVKFYIGGKNTSVELVGTDTFANAMRVLERPLYLADMNATDDTDPTTNLIRPFDGYLDNIRIYGSHDNSGVLTIDQLETIRSHDCNPNPSQTNSSILLSSQQCSANGVDEINITVTLKNEDEYPLSGLPVSLSSIPGTGDFDFDAMEGITNADGQVFFNLISKKSGTANLVVTILPSIGEAMTLDNQPFVEFTQVIQPSNCMMTITSKDKIVSADNYSFHVIDVFVGDYDNKPIANQEVSLTTSSELVPFDNIQTTNGDGIASFKVKAIDSFEPVSGEINATFSEYSLTGTVNFAGRLRVEDDGEPYSSVNLTRILAPGLNMDLLRDEKVPTDGVSYWKIEAQLIGDAIEGRKVSVQVEDQVDGIVITPTSSFYSVKDKATFCVSSTNTLVTNVKVTIFVEDDVNALWEKELRFIPDSEVGLYVVEVYPEPNTKKADINKPFIIRFNKSIELINGAEIIFSPNPELGDVYGDGYRDDLWILTNDNTITWIHDSLYANVDYTVIIKGIKDLQGGEMEPFTWKFSATDNEKPYIISMEPISWAVDVPTESEVKIQFSENLQLANGCPLGLRIIVSDGISEHVILPVELEYLPIDLDSGKMYSEISFLFPFIEDSSYQISVSGAIDYGQLVMEPISWRFSTVKTEEALRVIFVDLDQNERGDVLIDTNIKIYFDQKLDHTYDPKIILKEERSGITIHGLTGFIEDANNTGLLYTPSTPLANDTLYEITLENVVSEGGYSLSDYRFIFVTEVKGVNEPITEEQIYVLSLPQKSGGETVITVHLPESNDLTISSLSAYNVRESDLDDLKTRIYNTNLSLTPEVYELRAYEDAEELFDGKLTNPMSITFTINEEEPRFVKDLNGDLVPLESLSSYWWNPIREQWIPIGGIVDNVNKTITFNCDRFGIFGLIGFIDMPKSFLTDVNLTCNPLILNSGDSRSETTFKFRLAYDSKITITLYDQTGRQVATIIEDQFFPAGFNGFAWNGSVNGLRLKPGVYIYRLYAASQDSLNPNYTWDSGTVGVFY